MEKTITLPEIPRKVAEAIECLRSEPGPFDNARIADIAVVRPDRIVVSPHVTALRSIPFDTLMLALSVGYTVERTPEEIAAERKANAETILRRVYEGRRSHGHVSYDLFPQTVARDCGFADGMRYALSVLSEAGYENLPSLFDIPVQTEVSE